MVNYSVILTLADKKVNFWLKKLIITKYEESSRF